MKILLTCQPVVSDLRAVMPTVRALRHRGHEVVAAVPRFMHAEAAEYRVEAVSAGPDWRNLKDWPGHRDWRSRAESEGDPVRQFLGEALRLRVEDLIELGRARRVDLVLREGADFGGCLAAEVLGVPDIAIANTAGGRHWGHSLAGAVARLRSDYGLEPDPDFSALNRHLYVNLMPPAYDDVPTSLPNSCCYRHASAERVGERLPDWVADLPTDRPLVVVAFGMFFHPAPLQTIVSALERVPCCAIVRVGQGLDRFEAPPHPDTIRLVDSMPQPLVLQCADLFVNHGGFQGIRESLSAGVPMVIRPLLDDHPYNAELCANLGVARSLTGPRLDAAELADACCEVLGDPRYRRRARAIQRAILALPTLDQLAEDLEARVG
jgi:N-glycosyltransferase